MLVQMNVLAAPRALKVFNYNSQDSTVQPGAFRCLDQFENSATPNLQLTSPLAEVNGGYVFAEGSDGYHAANGVANVERAIEVFREAYGEPFQWATGKEKLLVNPDAGDQFDAYYDRDEGGLFFYHGLDPVTQQRVYPSDSGEVVTHESGHALLDAIRPHYFDVVAPDGRAFHESFGDILAMICSLQDERVRARLAQETGGDLSRPNLVAAWGEQIGQTLHHLVGHDNTGGNFVRNALNSFVWQDPATLPQNPPFDQLGREEHNFSRLWTGANYDLLKGLVEQAQSRGMEFEPALKAGADELMRVYGRLFRHAPDGEFTYRDMARAMLAADGLENGGQHRSLIEQVFSARQILQPQDLGTLALPERGVYPFQLRLSGERFGALQGAVVSVPLSGGKPADEQATTDRLLDQVALQLNSFQVRWEDGQMVLARPHRAS